MWFKWLLISLYVIELAVRARDVGKPRQPLTGNDIVLQVFVAAAIIAGVLVYWH